MKTASTEKTKKTRAKKAPTPRCAKSHENNGREIPSFNERFKDYIGIIKDGPPDLAKNHKLYACGAKKWPDQKGLTMKTSSTEKTKKTRAKKAPALRRAKPHENNDQKRLTWSELFKDYIGIIKDAPPDLARNHKLYASGAKKWK
ncbi:MAG: hypothetical protein FWD53_00155 [Phycisphaerales bacterium]|nr:hypothetical protein [Phycisphaerales bacterium]